jgi:AraC-like DNA-binding protein
MAYGSVMDVLGDIVALARTGPATSLRVEIRSPWAVHIPQRLGPTFHVLLQGTCLLSPPDGSTPLALKPGDIVLLPRGQGHVLADDPATPPIEVPCFEDANISALPTLELGGDGARSLLLSGGYRLDYGLQHPLLAALPDVLHVPADPGHHGSLRSAISLLGDELERDRPGASAVIPALVDALFPLIVRAWLDQTPDPSIENWHAALSDTAVGGALEQLHRSPRRTWTIASLAGEVGLSRAAFARRFTAAVGEPPLAYLTRWRMILAGRLLRDTDMTLAAVAHHVGYSSEFAFAKAFKRDHGIAPGVYRRRNRRPDPASDTPEPQVSATSTERDDRFRVGDGELSNTAAS